MSARVFLAAKRLKRHPLLAGVEAARANFLPGLFIQLLMLGLLIGYYRWPALHDALEVIGRAKQRYGYAFSMLGSAIAGGLLPELLRVLVLQHGRATRANANDAAFGVCFWAFMGFCADTFYTAQGHWFGTTPTVGVVLTKMAVDQFIYTPLWGTAIIVIIYEWRRRGYSRAALGEAFTPRFYRIHTLPALITGWALWIPLVSIVYALPPLLQYPLSALGTCFWSLLVTFMGRQTKEPLAFGNGAEPER